MVFLLERVDQSVAEVYAGVGRKCQSSPKYLGKFIRKRLLCRNPVWIGLLPRYCMCEISYFFREYGHPCQIALPDGMFYVPYLN